MSPLLEGLEEGEEVDPTRTPFICDEGCLKMWRRDFRNASWDMEKEVEDDISEEGGNHEEEGKTRKNGEVLMQGRKGKGK